MASSYMNLSVTWWHGITDNSTPGASKGHLWEMYGLPKKSCILG